MITKKAWILAMALLGINALAAACSDDDSSTNVDGGTDGDTDSDSDSDTDTDTDSDSDSDTDTDTDTDTDADVCPEGEECPVALDGNTCRISGTITENQHWTSGINYVLEGGVFIGNDSAETTLCIDAGTTIYGSTTSATTAALIIQRHSKIYANGTATDPVVFTSSAMAGEHVPGDWGGVVINGLAPINGCTGGGTCELEGEGSTGMYGGDDEDDDSGVFKYVRIMWSGKQLTPTSEFNGLALQGVGAGTEIHHVHIHQASDDLVEFFGGTANLKYLIGTGGQDDQFDWTNGWTGKAQFVVAVQFPGAGANNGIEADNLEGNEDYLPRSNPTLYNFTLVGNGDGADSAHGILLRRGTAATLRSFAVMNFPASCLNIDGATTWTQADGGDLTIENSALDCATNFADDASNPDGKDESVFFGDVTTNDTGDFDLADPFDLSEPDFMPGSGSILLGGGAAPPGGDSFFEDVDFIGAVAAGHDWVAEGLEDGWIAMDAD